MIKSETVAAEVSTLILEINEKLNDSICMVQDTCDEEDFKTYRQAIGRVLGEMLFQVVNPLYEDHPSLKPEWLR
jgi:hypothetical protein